MSRQIVLLCHQCGWSGRRHGNTRCCPRCHAHDLHALPNPQPIHDGELWAFAHHLTIEQLELLASIIPRELRQRSGYGRPVEQATTS